MGKSSGYKKSKFVVLTYNPLYEDFWFYTQSHLDKGWSIRNEFDLSSYIKSDNMLNVVAMLYPQVPIDALKSALESWENMPSHLPDDHYYFRCRDNTWE